METELKKSLGLKINKTASLVNLSLNHRLKEFDIAIEQRATLDIIKHEDGVNQTMIAQILGKDKTTISRNLKSLEKKELIIKESIDRRTNLIKLTKKGEAVLEKSEETIKEFRTLLSSALSNEELDLFINILGRIDSLLEA